MVLNFVGSFPNPWTKKGPKREREQYDKDKWNPSVDDFQAAALGAKVIEPTTFSRFLGAIQQQKPGTIERINLISHGGDGLYALAGTIGEMDGAVFLTKAGALTSAVVGDTEPIYKDGVEVDSLGTTARKLRDRFAAGAVIYCYVCHSGAYTESGLLLQELANAFRVKTAGFSDTIRWFVQWQQAPKHRGWVQCGGAMQRGIGNLKPNILRAPK